MSTVNCKSKEQGSQEAKTQRGISRSSSPNCDPNTDDISWNTPVNKVFMATTTIAERLAELREVMTQEHIDAFIFPSTDPHNGEYVPDHWQGREFISGFNGSAGTAVVTRDAAALWTDSRYFIAAEEQLSHTEFVLMKERMEGTPTISQWLGRKLAAISSPQVGIDGFVNSVNTTESLINELRENGGITLRTNFDPLEKVWHDRPQLPLSPVTIHPLEYAGESTPDKLRRIREALRSSHADGMLVSALDDIAWTLNLRGEDVHCNPVFVSCLLIDSHSATLFVDSRKLTAEVRQYLSECGVATDEYGKVGCGLRSYGEYNILMDPDETNYALFKTERRSRTVLAKSPIPAMKAVKNDVEVEGFRRAMLRDGVAMVKFLRWLKPAVAKGGQTEMSIDRKLTDLRAANSLFRGLSFDTIAAYGEHGAIVHYEATADTDAELKSEGLVLIDSGAQYLDGTTDITRTVALGPVTNEMRRVYTLVLKGHLRLEMCKFPMGASGTQIDALAREAMWREGMNYLHGTGHGVGSYLNVHEGPHQIRMEWKPTPLVPGMTVTDEPGLYLAGRFGVRTENTLLITHWRTTEFGRFLQFEPLTLCPIDTAPIDLSMLTDEERGWLNAYHAMVYSKLSPLLDDEDDRAWLADATKEV